VNVFPDIDEYAFLSDCETNALIAPSGQVEWLCVPRPDSASIFGTVLTARPVCSASAPLA
jgi:alpha,alpha-trehalase